jgi:translation initiation factor 5B
MAQRQPIVAVLGHVDHGKTTLLDRIRGTGGAGREAGAITQHIGATEVPLDTLEEVCSPVLGEGREFHLPGLLFIDTPGHHAFASLRSRGGALADIAVLVVDVNDGVMPQTEEAIQILKRNGTPFVVAANKIDAIPGWDAQDGQPFAQALQAQSESARGRLDEAVYDIIGDVTQTADAPANRYDQIEDFRANVAVVPVSAETGEGIPDLLLVLLGLAQQFLEEELQTDVAAEGQGTILEVKEEQGFGLTLDTIVSDGSLREGDHLVIAGPEEPRVTRVKALLKPRPLDEIRDPGERFQHVDEVQAAAGVKVAAPDLEGVTAGAPFSVATDGNLEEVRRELQEEFSVDIPFEDDGVLIKADTLGSLEALARELDDRDIPVHDAGVGDVSRRDVVQAETIEEPIRRAVLGFNVDVLPEAEEELESAGNLELFEADIIYELLDNYDDWVEERTAELEEDRRDQIVHPGKFKVLPDHTFRMSKPAIVGVRVLAGRIRPGQRILLNDGRVVGPIKSIREEDKSLDEAKAGDEVAIALAGVTAGRQVEEGGTYHVNLPEGDASILRSEGGLNPNELDVLDEVCQIKREHEKDLWGM